MTILARNYSNRIKILILYFIGYFATCSQFPITFFENEETISIIFELIHQSSLMLKQCFHVFQNLTSISIPISRILFSKQILNVSYASKPYFRIPYTVLNIISTPDFQFTDQIIQSLNIFVLTYTQAGTKEQSAALLLMSFLQSHQILDYSSFNLHQYFESNDKDIINSACELLLSIESPSFTYLPDIISIATRGLAPIETTFEILLKNHESWSGYNKDVVFEFIRESLINGSYDQSKLAAKLYLAYCNNENEWDYEIINNIIKYCEEPELAIEMFKHMLQFAESIKNGEELEGYSDILDQISIYIDEYLISSNNELSELASLLSNIKSE
ncbi:hypothetical protein TVAG_314930 [Trichomonas vaginalis G3]|uniref:Uncharacterized protein n=1 Tax=Trichomonas vaginalis (strain ATCC PRA-98 / G3) TaxID=412133 RepID=A2ETT2_TRIV3|nr:hypothetical protein TVAGG3_0045860 [Trichomonas vaginalis G3]EAY03963.1 hypothetical protein TVAG_314930 [Trichomonas vaginalis G3]KAI5541019.1 hypothetical protein TVAGG3_0045860 [Trichomonas vaginalis G3]|eukprot:XP_001316186.1 hypothetical protein [Trichomonas vaginalis G3]